MSAWQTLLNFFHVLLLHGMCFYTHMCTSVNLCQFVKCWSIITPSEHISPKAANEDSRQTCQRELSGKMAGMIVMLISHVVKPYPLSLQTPWLVVHGCTSYDLPVTLLDGVFGLMWFPFFLSVSSISVLRSPKSCHATKGTFLLFEHGAFHQVLSHRTCLQEQPGRWHLGVCLTMMFRGNNESNGR